MAALANDPIKCDLRVVYFLQSGSAGIKANWALGESLEIPKVGEDSMVWIADGGVHCVLELVQ